MFVRLLTVSVALVSGTRTVGSDKVIVVTIRGSVIESLGSSVGMGPGGSRGTVAETSGKRVVNSLGRTVKVSGSPELGSTVNVAGALGNNTVASEGTMVVSGISVTGTEISGIGVTTAGMLGNRLVTSVGTMVTISGRPVGSVGSTVRVAVTSGRSTVASLGRIVVRDKAGMIVFGFSETIGMIAGVPGKRVISCVGATVTVSGRPAGSLGSTVRVTVTSGSSIVASLGRIVVKGKLGMIVLGS